MTVESFRTARHDASRYGKATRTFKNQSGGNARGYHAGTLLACHSAAPPPVEEYDRWLEATLTDRQKRHAQVTGTKLRRMVVMKRNGCSLTEIGRGCGGFNPKFASNWLAKLPPELAA
jgi:hypothetical protein